MMDIGCIGIIGRLFGHKFRGRYDTTGHIPDSLLGGTFEATPTALRLLRNESSTYRFDVCVRCGACAKPVT